jgi:hypothetical protein
VGNLPGGLIATGQAFWVQATGASPTLSVNENAKVSPSGAYYRIKAPEISGLDIALNHATYTDNVYLVIDEKATSKFDAGLDAPKMITGVERFSVSLLAEDSKMAYYYANRNDLSGEIALSIAGADGDYELAFSQLGEGFPVDEFFLVDRYLGTSSPITTSYRFTLNSSPGSKNNRFFLTRNAQPLLSSESSILVHYYPNPVNDILQIDSDAREISKVSLMNSVGQPVESVELREESGRAKGQVNMLGMPSGVYFIRATGRAGKAHTYKIIKR